jgi:hypothetical protein
MKSQITLGVLFCLITQAEVAFAQEVTGLRESIRDSFPGSYEGLVNTYDASDVPELLAMLHSEDEEESWSRVVGVLGVVGDDDVADALIEFIEEPVIGPTYISRARHDARNQAMRALGFLAGRTGSERALDYLIASLDVGIWRRRNLVGVIDYLDTYDRYDRQMSIYAIFGLALSGHPRAGEALRSLQQSPTQEQARADLDDTLDTWLEIYDLVAERGVAGMYEALAERQLEAAREAQRQREIQGR